jgi:hypothetical protein
MTPLRGRYDQSGLISFLAIRLGGADGAAKGLQTGGPSLEGRSEALGRLLLLLVLLAAMAAGVVSEVEEGGALALQGLRPTIVAPSQ